jgi:predicted DsbA family dithiol-disulfide isomerase
MKPLTIEIYSDLICPWCYIGRRRLGEALKHLEFGEPPNIVWRPFELNPNLPKSGLDRRAYRTAKFALNTIWKRHLEEENANECKCRNAPHDGVF